MKDKQFETLSDWNGFMGGRKVLVLRGSWEGEVCDFIEMVGQDEILKHPKNDGGKKIKMKVKTKYNTELLLASGEFMIIEKEIKQYPKSN